MKLLIFSGMKRRNFIKNTAMALPAVSFFSADLSGIERSYPKGGIEKRSLGSTGEKLSVIGFGGIVVKDATPAQASVRVSMAIEAGINYFDVAPSYGDAELKLGPALEPYRKNVFLACKTTRRTASEARKELEQSLLNMRTDYFDLYQHHAVTDVKDVAKIFGKDGAMSTFLEARKEGKIKYIGFSAHSVEAAMALMKEYNFDTILFPVNYATWHAGNFGPQVLEKAKLSGMGILALKAMAKGPWKEGADRSKFPKCWYEPLESDEEILAGLRFTMSHPVTSAIPPGDETLFEKALLLSGKIKPLKQSEIVEIKNRAMMQSPLFRYSS